MFSTITGTIKNCAHKSISLEIPHIGISCAIHVPNELMFSLEKIYTVYVYLHWHQENGPTLYGFSTESEKLVFGTLIGCSGIGPKLALTILGNLSAQECINAIIQEKIDILSTIPGIGKRKAEHIIVQLKNSIASLAHEDMQTTPLSTHLNQISEVLTSLNYSRKEIARALQHIKSQAHADDTFDILLRSSLSFLSKAR